MKRPAPRPLTPAQIKERDYRASVRKIAKDALGVPARIFFDTRDFRPPTYIAVHWRQHHDHMHRTAHGFMVVVQDDHVTKAELEWDVFRTKIEALMEAHGIRPLSFILFGESRWKTVVSTEWSDWSPEDIREEMEYYIKYAALSGQDEEMFDPEEEEEGEE
jgi:hypothetical protein